MSQEGVNPRPLLKNQSAESSNLPLHFVLSVQCNEAHPKDAHASDATEGRLEAFSNYAVEEGTTTLHGGFKI